MVWSSAMTQCYSALLVISCFACWTCATSMSYVAHRGASAKAPESTLAAMQLAWELGADGVEFDVMKSADGEVFLLHDQTLERTASKTCPDELCRDGGLSQEGYVEQLTHNVAELSYHDFIKHVDVGSWKDSKYAGERPPLLGAAMEAVTGERFALCEIKSKDPAIAPLIAKLAAEKSWSPENFKIIGFDLELMSDMKNDFLEGDMQNPVYHLAVPFCWWQTNSVINAAAAQKLDGASVLALFTAVNSFSMSSASGAGKVLVAWVNTYVPGADTCLNALWMKNVGVDFFATDLTPSVVGCMQGSEPPLVEWVILIVSLLVFVALVIVAVLKCMQGGKGQGAQE